MSLEQGLLTSALLTFCARQFLSSGAALHIIGYLVAPLTSTPQMLVASISTVVTPSVCPLESKIGHLAENICGHRDQSSHTEVSI